MPIALMSTRALVLATETSVFRGSLCAPFVSCSVADVLQRFCHNEIGDLQACAGPLKAGGKLFTYARYDAELSREGLDKLGCPQIEPKTVQKLDSVDGIEDLWKVGVGVGNRVKAEHFAGFPAT